MCFCCQCGLQKEQNYASPLCCVLSDTCRQLAQLLQHWGVSSQPTSDSSDSTAAAAAACRAELRSKLWLPSTSSGSGSSGSRVSAEVLAADSAAACQLALRAAPPTQLAAVSLRCNASVLAAASNALADAAS